MGNGKSKGKSEKKEPARRRRYNGKSKGNVRMPMKAATLHLNPEQVCLPERRLLQMQQPHPHKTRIGHPQNQGQGMP